MVINTLQHAYIQTSLKGPFLINFHPRGTMHVIVDKTRQFYHKICGDPVEENAFVLFIDITVMMKAANQ